PGAVSAPPVAKSYSRREIVSAWVPWVLLTVFVFLWGLPLVKSFFQPTVIQVKVPGLHQEIARHRPAVEERKVEDAVFDFNWLSATGTSIFLAAAAASWWLAITPYRLLRSFASTAWQMRWPLFTIACMLAIAFTTRYTGMDATLGLAFTKTG